MNEHYFEQPQDDDVEIVDLDALEEAEAKGTTRATIKTDMSKNTSLASVPPPPRRSALRSRWTARQRVFQLVVIACVTLLLLSLFLGSFTSTHSIVSGLLHLKPTMQPSPQGASDLFYVQGSPSWGQLFIDGRRMARVPVLGVDRPLRLSRGSHLLRWQANPFQPLSCTVSIPFLLGADTCLYNEAVPVGANSSAWIITFSSTLENLPQNLRASLIQTAQAALDSQQTVETVQPGELYALSPSQACKPSVTAVYCLATARQPLKATLSFHLDTVASQNATCSSFGLGNSCIFQRQDCHRFCTVPAQLLHAGSVLPSDWNVFAVVRSSWTYALPDGRVIARNQPDSFLDYEEGNEYFVALQITWNGSAWGVTVLHGSLLSNPTCTEAENEVETGGFLGNAKIPFAINWNVASGATQAAGCVVVASPAENTDTTPFPSTQPLPGLYCLHRFGVLLAANALAHRYWPYLPVADPYEQHLARNLAILVAESL